ncbi:uncharacterized protein LOC113004822 [Solenopsis invicta]|uniref:uncharacterized protein LOC113004822 n=1 Tax=Solenopsis invicta TaxID=13686 RepID=UPI00193CB823|nr:uncharacterized protein LOC113004822 [Solenopsis invicta]
MSTCFTKGGIHCEKHNRVQLARKTYCRNHVDGFLAEGDDKNRIHVSINLCYTGMGNTEYLNVEDREDTPTWPRYTLGFSDNYNFSEDEEELNNLSDDYRGFAEDFHKRRHRRCNTEYNNYNWDRTDMEDQWNLRILFREEPYEEEEEENWN